MKSISKYDEIISREDELGTMSNVCYLYMVAKEVGNETIDFYDTFSYIDIPACVAEMREMGITEFTVSSGFSSLTGKLYEFVELGCEITGMRTVNTRYSRRDDDGNYVWDTKPAVVLSTGCPEKREDGFWYPDEMPEDEGGERERYTACTTDGMGHVNWRGHVTRIGSYCWTAVCETYNKGGECKAKVNTGCFASADAAMRWCEAYK